MPAWLTLRRRLIAALLLPAPVLFASADALPVTQGIAPPEIGRGEIAGAVATPMVPSPRGRAQVSPPGTPPPAPPSQGPQFASAPVSAPAPSEHPDLRVRAADVGLWHAVPGVYSRQTIRIENRGDATLPVTFVLAHAGESLGRYGGRLTDRLELSVRAPGAEWSGQVRAMPALELGSLPAGAASTVHVRLHWPDGGVPRSPRTGDNAFQGAKVRLRFAARSPAA